MNDVSNKLNLSNLKSKKLFNVDLGAASKFMDDKLTLGVVVKNLFPNSLKDESKTFKFSPELKVGVLYNYKRFNLSTDLDVTANKRYFSNYKEQYLSLGAEVDLTVLALRSGLKE